ncbi:MAG: DUF4962 domain-containing protein [Victivallaceae bacterium]|nr:DUF4962 domain-containing protein [Victivallaceae bacterium]
MITAAELLKKLPNSHPRHIYFPEDLAGLKATHQLEFQKLAVNRAMALASPVMRENDAPDYRRSFELARFRLDRDAVACALLYLFNRDREAGSRVHDQVMELCRWNCSVAPPFDEVALSVCRTLPALFDWTFDLYSPEEKAAVAAVLLRHGRDIARRIAIEDFANNPGNSHTSRLPGYLGEIAMALHGAGGDERETDGWLDYALNFYETNFPFYGDDDGGWAEGPFYASSYTKWFLPFFFAVKRICGHSFFNKPFYRNLSEFFIHFAPPEQESHPFGDGHWPTAAEWPGFQAQDPFGVYADSPLAKRFSSAARKNAEYFELHLLDLILPDAGISPRDSGSPFFLSRRAGFASVRRCPDDPENDVALLARASAYGSGSHRHADQGDFAILARGKTMLGPSGYFGYQFGTEHHRKWTTQTIAANCALIDGAGQPTDSPEATAAFTDFAGEHFTADLSAAYGSAISYERRFRFDRKNLVIEVRDAIAARRPVIVSWLLHSYASPEILADGAFVIRRPGAVLRGKVTPETALSVSDRFTVPCPGLPDQYHMTWIFPAAERHEIIARFTVELI